MIRFTPGKQPRPKVGSILLSEPFLDDPYFGRKAVLLCEHNEEGSFGFVLNNFVQIELKDILDDLPPIESKISVGGPVKNSNLYYLHNQGDLPNSVPVVNGIYMGGSFDALKLRMKSGAVEPLGVRFFIGYAGWNAQQLEAEIASKSWFVTRANFQQIMCTTADEDTFWKDLIRGMGDGFDHVADAPIDPSLN
jgi:putative transcriptional regulator